MNLVDAFRQLNPNISRFTWRKKNPIKQARLDYFLISESTLDVVQQCNIKSSYRSDHSIKEMSIKLNPFIKGRGVWKFNTSLLKNKDYLDLIQDIIVKEKVKYTLPVYSSEFIKSTNRDLFFKIDDDEFLENLLLRIRGESIKFATYLKNNKMF